MRPRRLLLLCAVLAAGIAGYALLSPSGVPKLREKRADLQALQADVATLERENERLRQAAARLRDDAPHADVHLEDVAREELGWVKPDEHVLLLPDPAREDARSERPSQGEAP